MAGLAAFRRDGGITVPNRTHAFARVMSVLALLLSVTTGNAAETDAEGKHRPLPSLLDEEFLPPAASRNHSCTIIIGAPGAMAPSIGRDRMSSKLIGGYPGRAQVLATNSSYRLSYDVPAGFALMPSGNSAAISFTGSFSGNGATDFLDFPASQEVRIKRGTTEVSLDLTATMNGSTFASGDYRAEAVLRCE
ncbi:hypothetical protein ACLB6G_15935 [Zhengella sp. ZM62]|uniref:hypothetical protein n=1 Tax=Zhengella sedimenti TaxID=3390035 RepID=UPI0039763F58